MSGFANNLIVNPQSQAALHLGAFRMLADSRAAEGEIGGDFYAFRLRGPKRLAGVIGDACGHGADGARLLPNVLTRLQQLALESVRPSHFLRELNALLALEMASDRFVTSTAFEIDGNAGTLCVANAGHVPAIVRRSSGRVVIAGRASGPPLGIMDDAVYHEQTFRFGSGDVLVLMTDGILEAVETDLSGMPRLTALMAQARGGSRVVHERLLARLADGATRGKDDMTLLSLELLGDERPTKTSRRIADLMQPM